MTQDKALSLAVSGRSVKAKQVVGIREASRMDRPQPPSSCWRDFSQAMALLIWSCIHLHKVKAVWYTNSLLGIRPASIGLLVHCGQYRNIPGNIAVVSYKAGYSAQPFEANSLRQAARHNLIMQFWLFFYFDATVVRLYVQFSFMGICLHNLLRYICCL